MILEQLISPDSVLCNAHARSKKYSLEILSELLANPNPDIASEEIFAKLIERERLGSTSLDKGIAFPHCRISSVLNNCGALIKLSDPSHRRRSIQHQKKHHIATDTIRHFQAGRNVGTVAVDYSIGGNYAVKRYGPSR